MTGRNTLNILISLFILTMSGCAPTLEVTLPVPGESQQSTVGPTLPAPSVGTAVPNLSVPLHELTATLENGPASQASPLPTLDERTSIVSIAENGKTLAFASGQRFVLFLDQGYAWQITIADPAIVALLDERAPLPDAQGYFEALQPGQTKISASGDPLCRAAKPPCMMPSILFDITIMVD